jgi:glycosyltransferase involved in cell wall biosynthesis
MSARPEQPGSERPAVTIVTPLFDSARFVPGLLANVSAQEFGDFEHLVVDDRSTDRGPELVREHARTDPRCRLVTMPERGGPARARDRALGEARGRYVAFLDADDRWLPAKLRLQVEFMRKGGIGFSYHDYRFMSADGTRVGALVRGPERLDFAGLHRHRGVGCSTVMIDLRLAPNLSFSRVRAARASDFVAWREVIRAGVVGHRLPHDLMRYRVGTQSFSSNKLWASSKLWEVFRDEGRIPLPLSALWWAEYAAKAALLHIRSNPRVPALSRAAEPGMSA